MSHSEALPAEEVLVFVYGTLLTGEPNHQHLRRARSLGSCVSLPEYDLVDFGDYPAMVPGGSTSIEGELYAVDPNTLFLLDEMEDHPAYYRRTPLCLADGTQAEAYLLGAERAEGFPRIGSGSWARRNSIEAI